MASIESVIRDFGEVVLDQSLFSLPTQSIRVRGTVSGNKEINVFSGEAREHL